ncbi:hypothetical protein KFL_009380040 [Klebsormidium nitens]|uniref:Reverse transcriptase domain-containing protein n=1 Tax=Klebsormidium nitens TaxID=105231 RepID=A0A1Y1IMQ1_KLENI|nr:hypothetical protein KFL_009380040 [Klebsormidium nitens]|eukprot:GAQ92175.1 hypothetical protein KFL_009380040 [Klebsormidium nitens]
MNDIFRPYLKDFVVVYLDDILVYSKTEEEHEGHLRLVMDVLRRQRFFVCTAKSSFSQRECKFLGHIVGADGIKVNPAKVAAVQDWPTPSDAHQELHDAPFSGHFGFEKTLHAVERHF